MYTIRETAENLNVSVKTLYRWVDENKYDINKYITRTDMRMSMSKEGLELLSQTRETATDKTRDNRDYKSALFDELRRSLRESKKDLEDSKRTLEKTQDNLNIAQQQILNMQVLLKNEQEKTKQLLLESSENKQEQGFWKRFKSLFN